MKRVVKASGYAALHGCEECRGDKMRHSLTDALLRIAVERKALGCADAVCALCGASWRATLFAVPPDGEIHVRFEPGSIN